MAKYFQLLLLSLPFFLSSAVTHAAGAVDDGETARELLRKLISNETYYNNAQVPAAAKELQKFFYDSGFRKEDVLYFPLKHAETGSLIVRYPGADEDAKPIIIMAHMDVVPANPDNWSYPPYKLTEEGGYFYGRGTQDNKAAIAVIATVLRKLKQAHFVPSSNVYFVISGDEETMAQTTRDIFTNLPVLKTAKYALNSDAGLTALDQNGKAVYYQLNTAEKTYMTFFARLSNVGGHSSLPRKDHAIYEMSRALLNLEAYQFPVRFNETTLEYFKKTATISDEPLRTYKSRFADDPNDAEAVAFFTDLPGENSIIRTTCTATMLEAGHAENALPMNVDATINCRVFPGVGVDEVQSHLERALSNPDIAILASFRPDPNPASDINPEVFSAVQAAVHQRYPGIPIIPYMIASSTDSAITRSAGIPTYGVSSFAIVFPEGKRAHGKDERLAVETFYEGIDYWEMLIRRLAKD